MERGVTISDLGGTPSTAESRFPWAIPAIRTKEVCVLCTSIEETRSAVRIANELAIAMTASLTLIDVRPTRHPLQPERPLAGSDNEIRALVASLRAVGMSINIRAYVCRNLHQAIPFAFSPHSVIVLGGRRSWFPTRPERLRRALEAAGHFVVVVDGALRAGSRWANPNGQEEF